MSPSEHKALANDHFSYDMFQDAREKIAKRRNETYSEKYLSGLPIGLKLPNGITIGA